ncbi:MAG: hypothetical protein D6732_05360, partial [Methanobacteriota archaeon]
MHVTIAGLTVLTGVSLTGTDAWWMTISGSVTNDGTITANNLNYPLNFNIGGGIVNNGSWDAGEIKVTGGYPHSLYTNSAGNFSPNTLRIQDSSLVATSTVYLNNVVVTGNRLVLNSGADLYLTNNSSINNLSHLDANNNAIWGVNNGYIVNYTTVHDARIKGKVFISSHNVVFAGATVVEDTL